LRTEAEFHDIDGAEEDDGGQETVNELVEDGISEVVIEAGNKECECEETERQEEGVSNGSSVREGGVEHDTRCINHRQLIDQLHGVFEGGVKGEAAAADDEVANEGDEEDEGVAVAYAVGYAFEGQVHEHEVGKGVDDLC